MNDLRITLNEGSDAFEPGQELLGDISWHFDKPPHALELRLFWFTRGKGDVDAGVIQSLKFDQPLPQETRSFRFSLPESPYSFSGKLISLVWALELIAYPSKEVARREIVIGPGRQEISLPRQGLRASGIQSV